MNIVLLSPDSLGLLRKQRMHEGSVQAVLQTGDQHSQIRGRVKRGQIPSSEWWISLSCHSSEKANSVLLFLPVARCLKPRTLNTKHCSIRVPLWIYSWVQSFGKCYLFPLVANLKKKFYSVHINFSISFIFLRKLFTKY